MVNAQLMLVTMTTVAIMGGLIVLWIAVDSRSKVREMAHRERLAMIERGVAPPPERDPAGFEERIMPPMRMTQRRSRSRSAGIIMVGLGFALMILLTFTAGEPNSGIGIGGAVATLGIAFFINSLFVADEHRQK